MNIVLLGANGYVGRAIMRAAIACPQHVQVWAQARTTDDLQTAHNVRLFKGSLEQVHPQPWRAKCRLRATPFPTQNARARAF